MNDFPKNRIYMEKVLHCADISMNKVVDIYIIIVFTDLFFMVECNLICFIFVF